MNAVPPPIDIYKYTFDRNIALAMIKSDLFQINWLQWHTLCHRQLKGGTQTPSTQKHLLSVVWVAAVAAAAAQQQLFQVFGIQDTMHIGYYYYYYYQFKFIVENASVCAN